MVSRGSQIDATLCEGYFFDLLPLAVALLLVPSHVVLVTGLGGARPRSQGLEQKENNA